MADDRPESDAAEPDRRSGAAGHPPRRPGWRTRPHPSRLAPDAPGTRAALDAHDRAVDRGDPGYLDPATGLFVMTAVYLHERGRCCDRGCRHCPFVGAAEPPDGRGPATSRRTPGTNENEAP